MQNGKNSFSISMKNIRRNIKLTIFDLILPILRLFASLFFEEKYLHGRYFDRSTIGWRWVFRSIIWQKLFRFNNNVPWPVSPFIVITDPNNIEFDIECLNNFQMWGNYFQCNKNKIHIGKNTWIAPNVGMITANHEICNLKNWVAGEDIIIGDNCWIGMNSMILPGVKLGNHTIVGAGSVVTKSFPEGNVVIAGNPAKIVKIISKA